jgi:mono/diheme cytochrome c family protein
MKRLFHLNGILLQITIIAIVANTGIASGQSEKSQQFQIPQNINKIFQTLCLECHGINGGRFPKSKMNFSRWEGYSEGKKTEKAILICSTLRKGKMPPKSRRDSNPELIPTKEQVDLICAWAESLKSQNVSESSYQH